MWSLSGLMVGLLLAVGCTGGSESSASVEKLPSKQAPSSSRHVNPRQAMNAINPAIPVYQGAQYRPDLTKRDEPMVHNQYGPDAKVYTLATDDSFPEVYHYYTTYLAQFRAFPSQDTYPPQLERWRTLQVKLNDAMQDPFIPGAALDPNGKQVTLQIVETEAEPETVIRYIVTPAPHPAPIETAAKSDDASPLAR